MTHLTEAERQIITSLSWFRTRYALFLNLDADRKADGKSIEEFAKIWIGNFKCDWSGSFETLLEKGILTSVQGEYQFTPKGEAIKRELEAQVPFFKYEYDHFFDLEKGSAAHAALCKAVYGSDLSQHGLIDMEELSVLMDKLKEQQPGSVADLGCGNGKITEYLADALQTDFTGYDISTEAIRLAKIRTEDNPLLQFKEGNLNRLELDKKYDAILFLDTLYYAEDLEQTIRSALNQLTANGRLFAYFSQWIMDTAYVENLHPDNTHLGKVLTGLGADFTSTDLTSSGIRHWKKKLDVLQRMKSDFEHEGNPDLWEYRHREAVRYANWGDDKYARYLYEVRNRVV